MDDGNLCTVSSEQWQWQTVLLRSNVACRRRRRLKIQNLAGGLTKIVYARARQRQIMWHTLRRKRQ